MLDTLHRSRATSCGDGIHQRKVMSIEQVRDENGIGLSARMGVDRFLLSKVNRGGFRA
jgi:hypothetical protein